ncbi:hypothetical protein POQMFEI_00038 [Enterococcus phage vB_OCPT_CCS2]|nr:hypothetical protein POQMFEI_00038 [Enterococcus phage vB_OCPT_CCS2]
MLIRVNEAEGSNDFIEYIQLAESYGKVQLELFVEDVEEDSAYNVSDFYMDEETVDKLIKALQSFKKGGN